MSVGCAVLMLVNNFSCLASWSRVVQGGGAEIEGIRGASQPGVQPVSVASRCFTQEKKLHAISKFSPISSWVPVAVVLLAGTVRTRDSLLLSQSHVRHPPLACWRVTEIQP